MLKLKALIIALTVVAAPITAAQAADMPRQFPIPEEPPTPPVVEFLSGWYVRGDLGYRFDSIQGIDAPVPVISSSYDNSFSIGGGAGYKWNFIRADLTIDYGVRSKVQGDTTISSPYYTAKMDALTTLANVYVDFGTWWGFTPYVGVGGGMTRFSIKDFKDATSNIIVVPSETWKGSWAMMAGASFQISQNVAIDVGYRYLSLGGGAITTPDASTGLKTTFRDLTSNEVRIGLRLLLD